MTKPSERKKPGPKPKPKADAVEPVEVAVASVDADDAAIREAVAEAVADSDEPAAPEHALPLIDGTDPKWAITAAVGARHVQFTAHDHITVRDLVGMLDAKTITIPGHATPILIAARTLTPPEQHPARVTFTVRERINA